MGETIWRPSGTETFADASNSAGAACFWRLEIENAIAMGIEFLAERLDFDTGGNTDFDDHDSPP
jgi:hypothetical protein